MDYNKSSLNQPNFLNITPEEWAQAKSYFASNKKVKFRRSHDAGNERAHSFIKVEGQIYAVANKLNPAGYLGEGAFGRVKMVQTETGNNFALKVEGRGPRTNGDIETQVMKLIDYLKGEAVRELERTQKYKDKNTKRKLYTVTKLRSGEELFKKLYADKNGKRRNFINHRTKVLIALKACEAIKALQDKNIVHADIKPENLMALITDEKINIESIDYGFSLILPNSSKSIKLKYYCGTPDYMAPEIQSYIYSYASDIYALGIMLEKDLFLKMQTENPRLKDLIESMTQSDPDNRPDMEHVIQELRQAFIDNLNSTPAEEIQLNEIDYLLESRLNYLHPQLINEIIDNISISKAGSVLIWAAENGHSEIIYRLLQKHTLHHNSLLGKFRGLFSSKPSCDFINTQNQQGNTPLMLAVGQGHVQCVRALLEKKADMGKTNQEGKTALNFAVKPEIITLLQEASQNLAAPACFKRVIYRAKRQNSTPEMPFKPMPMDFNIDIDASNDQTEIKKKARMQ